MTIEIKQPSGIEQAAHDIGKAREFERLAASVSEAKLDSIKIQIGPNDSTYLSSVENIPDDYAKGELIGFLSACAARHRQAAQAWTEFALQGE